MGSGVKNLVTDTKGAERAEEDKNARSLRFRETESPFCRDWAGWARRVAWRRGSARWEDPSMYLRRWKGSHKLFIYNFVLLIWDRIWSFHIRSVYDIYLRTKLQGRDAGFNTGNGEKLSYSPAASLALLGCSLVSLHLRC